MHALDCQRPVWKCEKLVKVYVFVYLVHLITIKKLCGNDWLELENCCMQSQKSYADVKQCYCIILEIKELCSI